MNFGLQMVTQGHEPRILRLPSRVCHSIIRSRFTQISLFSGVQNTVQGLCSPLGFPSSQASGHSSGGQGPNSASSSPIHQGSLLGGTQMVLPLEVQITVQGFPGQGPSWTSKVQSRFTICSGGTHKVFPRKQMTRHFSRLSVQLQ